ncbi:MAG: MOP flippase family protein [Rhodocyclaceae bacterium]|nr:MOP flippase family protein [Rhodocyclaceae bacterium]
MSNPEAKVSLGVAATRGVMWTGGGQVVKQLTQISTSVLLARLLTPQDFGLLGMALVFVGVAQLFSDFGIGSAVVQGQSHDQTALSSAFWANLAVAGVLTIFVILASPWVAHFYVNPDIGPVVAATSLTLFLAGAQAVPQAILYRDMRFADTTKANILGSVAGSIVALTMAWQGFGVWSLVAQPLVGSTLTLVLIFRLGGWLPSPEFSLGSIRDLVRFSGGLFGANMVTYMQRNTDSLLIGKYIGSGPLGYYQMAYQLMLYPLQQVSGVIVRVLFPTLSKLQNDLPRLREGYLKAISGIALITFPMMMGLFAVADEFIRFVFGEKWVPMLPILQILSWVGLLQSISSTVGSIYMSQGKVRQLFLVSLGSTPVLVLALAIGLQWNILGVAAGYAFATFVVFYFSIFFAFRLVGLSLKDFHLTLWRPFLCALIMMGMVRVAAAGLPDMPIGLRFGLLVGAGVLVYTVASLLINRAHLAELKVMILSATGRNQ